jgi:hypothetical protein
MSLRWTEATTKAFELRGFYVFPLKALKPPMLFENFASLNYRRATACMTDFE